MLSNMKIFITEQQKAELERLHDSSRDGRVRDRIKAILLASEGWSSAMIAQALRLHQTTIDHHISEFLNKGKLKPENGGSDSKLSAEQTAFSSASYPIIYFTIPAMLLRLSPGHGTSFSAFRGRISGCIVMVSPTKNRQASPINSVKRNKGNSLNIIRN